MSGSGKKPDLLDDSSIKLKPKPSPDTSKMAAPNPMPNTKGRVSRGMLLARTMNAQKPAYFNLLCVGKSNVGKSSFLERLIFKAFGKKEVIDRSEKGFVEHITERKDGNRRLILNVIDSKGYAGDYTVDKWYEDIKTLIKGKVFFVYPVRSL